MLTNRLATTPVRPGLTQGGTTRKEIGMEEQDSRENLDDATPPDSQEEAATIQKQIDACRRHCEERGIELVAEYIDRS